MMLTWLAVALAGTAAAWDVGEWLAAEGKSDSAAYDPAKCWCDKMTEAMDSRIGKADEEIRALQSSRTVRHFENERLKLELKQRHQEVGENTDSLNVASSISDKVKAKSEEELEDLNTSLKTIRKALETVPDGSGSGSHVHGALKTLEDNFSKRLKEAQDQQQDGQSKFEDLQATKQKMVRLAKEGAATLQARLAEGMAEEAEASAGLEAYSGQREADVVLRRAAQDLCSMLEDQSEQRQKLRQAAELITSKAKADAAKEEATNHALRSFSLLHKSAASTLRGAAAGVAARPSANSAVARRLSFAEEARLANDCLDQVERAKDTKAKAAELVAAAKKSASDLVALVGKSAQVQSALEQMLHEQMTNAANAERKMAKSLQPPISAIFDAAQAQLKTLSAPFDKVRAASRESTMADHRVVTQLSSAKARAAEAVVEAMRCESLLQLRR